jgi:hypothetical protein
MLCALFVTEKGSMLLAFTHHTYRIWFGNPWERNNLECLDVYGRIILK